MTKIYVSTPNKIHSSDKYFERNCIKAKISLNYLIPLLDGYGKFENIDFNN